MAGGEPRIADDRSSQLEKYVGDGNEVVEFKLIRTRSDIENEEVGFKPEMCHQIFNQSETIFGYENLKIQLYFTAGSLHTFLGIRFKSKVSQTLADGAEPDNLIEKLGAVLRSNYTSNLDDFSAKIDKEHQFQPFGELIHSFTVDRKPSAEVVNGSGRSHSNGDVTISKTYEIYVCDISIPKFQDYLIKMETFVLWFIDAASFLDSDDERWKFYVMYEKYKSSEGNTMYAFVGYSSVYNFYCYPELIRPRVAQMVILPPFQRQGLAVELLSAIYRSYRSNPKTKEITVEDPSDDFERLRDFVDARDCSKLSSYSNEKLKKGFSKEMSEEAKTVLKMTHRQARRVYEMLRLRVTNENDPKELKEYRLDVKRRLNIPYQKQQSDIKRMMRRKFNSTELQTASQLDDGSRKQELESNFNLLLSHYQYITSRLERDVES
ncbi:Histone acetyltransferase type B catalytic subunit [Orchesella cincta]|uniref:Histone acetyltransferase type B catalytic subunit n=1 Tax=Orchesella cincta TaxID=48709 RepID=A0A1D2MP96_ORCCI|nr:Histone acetyltransferase type B catalytic subunit [Orchesella cincta]